MARSAIATDNFNRADIGANWQVDLNNFNAGNIVITASIRVNGGVSQPDDGATGRWVGAGTFTDDQYSSLKIDTDTWVGINEVLGVVGRASGDFDGLRTYYHYRLNDTDGSDDKTTTLNKVVNGSATVLDSTPTTVSFLNAGGDRIEIECEGTTIRGLKNSVTQHQATDSAITIGNPGVMASSGTFGDDWEGGNITAAGGVRAPMPYSRRVFFEI